MRRILVAALGTGLLALLTGATGATGSSVSASRAEAARAAPSSASDYLPAGDTPCGSDWENAACDLAGSAYSPLTQLTTSNVGQLKLAWQNSYNGATWAGNTESQPIVVSGAGKNLPLASGTMFLDTLTGVDALNPTNGAILWTYQGPTVDAATGLAYPSYRVRVSYGNGMLYDVQQDRSLVALSAMTGKVVWTDQLSSVGTFGAASHQNGPGLSVFLPYGKDGLVITASNSGDGPLRGHVDAFDGKTGALVWRFFNTPDPTELPYILTWGNPANAAFGGVAVWTPPAYDPKLGLLYFGTGNPYPEDGRAPGEDLFSDSVVALSVKTGALKWYFQTTHHDEFDYDCPTPPVLFNTTMAGKTVEAIAVGCKNGYLYVLNRRNGGALPTFPHPETPIPNLNEGSGAALNASWPTQPIPTGGAAQLVLHCPTPAQVSIVFPSYPVGPDGNPEVATCPYASPTAGTWYMWADGLDYPRMSYDPQTNDLLVCARSRIRGYENVGPTNYNITTLSGLTAGDVGGVSALNMSTNTIDWQVQYDGATQGPCYSGVVSTAGGLVFSASQGNAPVAGSSTGVGGTFYAYDAKTGKQLWSWQAPDVIYSAPITYMVNGKQYVALMVNGPVGSGKRDLLSVFSL